MSYSIEEPITVLPNHDGITEEGEETDDKVFSLDSVFQRSSRTTHHYHQTPSSLLEESSEEEDEEEDEEEEEEDEDDDVEDAAASAPARMVEKQQQPSVIIKQKVKMEQLTPSMQLLIENPSASAIKGVNASSLGFNFKADEPTYLHQTIIGPSLGSANYRNDTLDGRHREVLTPRTRINHSLIKPLERTRYLRREDLKTSKTNSSLWDLILRDERGNRMRTLFKEVVLRQQVPTQIDKLAIHSTSGSYAHSAIIAPAISRDKRVLTLRRLNKANPSGLPKLLNYYGLITSEQTILEQYCNVKYLEDKRVTLRRLFQTFCSGSNSGGSVTFMDFYVLFQFDKHADTWPQILQYNFKLHVDYRSSFPINAALLILKLSWKILLGNNAHGLKNYKQLKKWDRFFTAIELKALEFDFNKEMEAIIESNSSNSSNNDGKMESGAAAAATASAPTSSSSSPTTRRPTMDKEDLFLMISLSNNNPHHQQQLSQDDLDFLGLSPQMLFDHLGVANLQEYLQRTQYPREEVDKWFRKYNVPFNPHQ